MKTFFLTLFIVYLGANLNAQTTQAINPKVKEYKLITDQFVTAKKSR